MSNLITTLGKYFVIYAYLTYNPESRTYIDCIYDCSFYPLDYANCSSTC